MSSVRAPRTRVSALTGAWVPSPVRESARRLNRLIGGPSTPVTGTALAQGLLGSLMIVCGSWGVGWLPMTPSSWFSRSTVLNPWRVETAGVMVSAALLVLGSLLMVRAWLRLGQRLDGRWREHRGTVLRATWLWNLPLVTAVPVFSRDAYSYLAQGRLMHEGLSPYGAGVSALPGWFMGGADSIWAESPSPYGPLFLMMAQAVWFLTGGGPEPAVLLFRAISLAGLALCLWAVPRLARRWGSEPQWATWVSVTNPLFALYMVAGVHNDSLMLGLLLCGFVFLGPQSSRGRVVVGLVLVALSVAIKPLTVLALPFAGLLLLPHAGDGGRGPGAGDGVRGPGAVSQPAAEPQPGATARALPERIRVWAWSAGVSFGVLLLLGAVSGLWFGWIPAMTTSGDAAFPYAPFGLLGLGVGWLADLLFSTGLRPVADIVYTLGTLTALAFTAWLALTRRPIHPVLATALSLTAAVLLAPIIQPWYLLWVLPLFAVVRRWRGWPVRVLYLLMMGLIVVGVVDQISVAQWIPVLAVRILTAMVGAAALVWLVVYDPHTSRLFPLRRRRRHRSRHDRRSRRLRQDQRQPGRPPSNRLQPGRSQPGRPPSSTAAAGPTPRRRPDSPPQDLPWTAPPHPRTPPTQGQAVKHSGSHRTDSPVSSHGTRAVSSLGPGRAGRGGGGAVGTRANPWRRWGSALTGRPDRTLVLILVGLTLVAAVLALLSKQWCRLNGWAAPDVHIHMCYSDFGQLFPTRGLAEGWFPFFTPLPEEQWMEYPALLAVVAGVTAWLVPGEGASLERTVTYFDINAVGVTLCWLVVVLATAYSARGRAKDALMVAVAPGIILTAFLNWDLWAVMLAALALLAWSRRMPVLSGVLLGLGAAMKLYPLFFFGALLVLCWRAGRMGAFWKSLAAGVVAWLAVNVPFMLTAFDQWSRFYTFSGDREVSFSSVWLALTWTGLSGEAFSLISNGLFALACAGVAWLGLTARHRPRMAQLCLLIVAAFLLLGKVYSPQFVMWLIPLVVLARPDWRQFWVWMAAEVYHWGGVWMESARITSEGGFGGEGIWIQLWYGSGIVLHMAAVIWICVSVIRDIRDPERDLVRREPFGADGAESGPVAEPEAGPLANPEAGPRVELETDPLAEPEADPRTDPPYDPLAGILADAPDAFVLGAGRRRD